MAKSEVCWTNNANARIGTVALILTAFLTGVAATQSSSATSIVVAVGVISAVAFARFSRIHKLHSRQPNIDTDWIIIALPVVLAIRTFYFKPSLLLIALLIVASFARNTGVTYRIYGGPLLLLGISSAIVFSRPTNIYSLAAIALVGILVVQLILTVDARTIIRSLVDGCGLYLVANVVGHAVGLQSPSTGLRIGGLVESTGFVRVIYPLTSALNTPATVAAVYVAAFGFLVVESGSFRRVLRVVCFVAAVLVLVGTGSRVTMLSAVLLTVVVIFLPSATRWVAQAALLLSASAPFVLPSIASAMQFAITPLAYLTPGRVNSIESITTIEGRKFVWNSAVDYWGQWVSGFQQVVFGFGANGQYGSGVWRTYAQLIGSTVRYPQLATVHNSFLQQLFDGGVVGGALLIAAIFWASVRMARYRVSWGNEGFIAITSLTVLLLSGITEVSVAPGPLQDTFWLLIFFVGATCQEPNGQLMRMTAAGEPERPRRSRPECTNIEQQASEGWS